MDREIDKPRHNLLPAPLSGDEDRLDLATLSRLATTSTSPPPLDYEEVAATPTRAAPSRPVRRGAEPAPRVRRPSGSRLAVGIVIGLLVGGVGASAAWLARPVAEGARAEDSVGREVEREAEPAVAEAHAAPTVPSVAASAPAPSSTPSAVRDPRGEPQVSAEPATAAAEAIDRASGAEASRSDRGAEASRTQRDADPPTPAEGEPRVASADPIPDNPFGEESVAPVQASEAPDAPTAAAPEPPAPARPATLAGLMDRAAALPEPGAAQPAPAEAAPVRATPTRSEVAAALEGLHGKVLACAEGEHGMVELQLTVASSGRVRSALVNGAFSGSAKGSCMARAARTVRFESFEDETFVVRYPFRI